MSPTHAPPRDRPTAGNDSMIYLKAANLDSVLHKRFDRLHELQCAELVEMPREQPRLLQGMPDDSPRRDLQATT